MAKVKVNGHEHLIEVNDGKVTVNGKEVQSDLHKIDKENYHLIYNGKSITVKVNNIDLQHQVISLEINGKEFKSHLVRTIEETIDRIAHSGKLASGHQKIISPMPGLIQKIQCTEGQAIMKGEVLVVLNAMKMENIIKAPEDGEIVKILIKEGEQVEKGKVLIQF